MVSTSCRAPVVTRSVIPVCCPAARTSTPSTRRRSHPCGGGCSESVVDKLIERQREEQGTWPETIACAQGTDNIKTYGESLAQILWFVGVKPMPDSVGRVNKLELIPLELGRPRVDVVVNCSGVFRDLFINQMALIRPSRWRSRRASGAELRAQARPRAGGERGTLQDAACRCSPTPAAATAPT